MIRIDDESPMTEQKYNLIIPIDVICYKDGREEIFVYSSFKNTAEMLERDHSGALISEETIELIHSQIKDKVREYGYEADEQTRKNTLHVYSVPDISELEADELYCELIQENTVSSQEISGIEDMENLTDLPIDTDIAFVTVEDGRIVSVATLNPHEDGDIMPEITVETAQGYEGRGYGTSNVCALALWLISNGMGGSYTCESDNPSSERIALKAGFTHDADAYYYVCYEI